jgi:hypothetical protein
MTYTTTILPFFLHFQNILAYYDAMIAAGFWNAGSTSFPVNHDAVRIDENCPENICACFNEDYDDNS